ncbi:unnamed protein product [Calicophoron daubneyi]|uniref:Tubulin polymerization-promoting protein family member 3 n=1 Tax=Calicophoron daubneyi TaxID=300641 RepID=A0AAV2TDF6_CALDB
MSDDLRTSFEAFCNFVKKGSNTATDKTLKKICTDCKIYGKGVDANRVDIEFRAFIGNTKRYVDYEEFVRFLDTRLAKVYATAHNITPEEAAVELRQKISSTTPAAHGATGWGSSVVSEAITDMCCTQCLLCCCTVAEQSI